MSSRFPDLERVIIPKIVALITGAPFSVPNPSKHVANRTSIDLQNLLPFVRAQVGGGTRDAIGGRARLDIQVFARTTAGLDLAEAIDELLVCGSPMYPLDSASTDVGPTEMPWADPEIRTWVSTYTLACRRK